MSKATRNGWTLVDLILVLVMLGALAALVVVALVHGRERARLNQCAENLRQIGIALQAYHDANRMLPPIAFREAESFNLNIKTSNGQSYFLYPTYANWIILLLPQLGKGELADSFDWHAPVTNPINARSRTTTLALMTCPSDTYHRADNLYRVIPEHGPESKFARGNYGINAGVDEDNPSPGDAWRPAPNGLMEAMVGTVDRPISQSWGSGVAGFNKSFSLSDFTNGCSNLVAVEELRAGLIADDCRGVWALGEVGASATRLHGLAGDDRGPNCQHPNADDTFGCNQVHEAFDTETLVEKGMPCASHAIGPQATARSMHPGGVNVLFMDGSTRFLTDDTDWNLWHVLHSRLSHEAALPTEFDPPPQPTREVAAVQPIQPKHPLPKGVQTISNALGITLVRIPAGEFTMAQPDEGEEALDQVLGTPPWAPPHRVRITRDFYLSAWEITQKQYQRVMGQNPSWHSLTGKGKHHAGMADTMNYPVEQVSWVDAVTFCGRLSTMAEEKAAGRHYRLPTEAEWEYACRAGSSKPFRYPIEEEANRMGFNMRPIDTNGLRVTSVGSYPPNAFGLYDMRGNVWEWCADWYGWDYYLHAPPDDPQGPVAGTFRVVRGADWRFTGPGCNLARFDTEPWKTNPFIGFRVVCELQLE